jgi:SNF2 family DNA or RNA helicase
MKQKINITPYHGSLKFSLETKKAKFINWQKQLELSSSMLYAILQELLDNGLASLDNNEEEVSVSPEGVYYLLDLEDGGLFRNFLKLPDYTNLVMLLESVGSQIISDSRFRLSYRHFKSVDPYPIQSIRLKPEGIFWMNDGRIHSMMRQKEFQLVQEIQAFNNRDTSSIAESYLLYGKVLETQKSCSHVRFEETLKGHDVFIPEKLELDLSKSGSSYELKANIVSNEENILYQPSFDKSFKESNLTKEIYTIPPRDGSTERIHIPFTKKQQEQLHKIKQYNHDLKTGKDIGDIISHPEKYFDISEIDISATFSERVIGLGEYQPLTRSFSSCSGNEWFPGIEIVDPVEGSKEIVFKKREDLDEFSRLVDRSIEEKQKTVPYEGYKIPIEEAQELVATAKKQFNTPDKPVSPEKKVLIIKENLDELEYTEEIRGKEVEHKLQAVPNLAKKISLKEHQKEGVAWMQALFERKEPGCLLADDMGLGKTLQVMSFIEWVSSNMPKESFAKVLISAPKSLLENWKNEYEKFFPEGFYSAIILTSNEKEYTRNLAIHSETWKTPTIIITNYETLKFNQIEMAKVKWDVVVLDEAQNIKTPGTLVTNAAKALNTRFRIALTGTPVENSFQDLWCLMDFSLPGLLGSRKEFNKAYSEKKESTDEELEYMGESIRSEIGPYIKRRNKSVLGSELKPKYISTLSEHNHVFPVDCSLLVQHMPVRQKEAYDGIRDMMKDSENRRQTVKYIGEMKKVSDHPDFTKDYGSLSAEFDSKNYWAEFASHSARLNAILPALDKIRKQKEKVLIFAEYRFTQYILKMILQDRFKLKDIKIINGDVSVTASKRNNETRQGIVNQFNDSKGFNILILSPIAAGTGLTITGANHVIHYSRHWNPAKENQATDRAYRIGQEKPVYVYYPMAVCNEYKTFDYILNDLLTRKNHLADSALFPSAKYRVTDEDIINATQESVS